MMELPKVMLVSFQPKVNPAEATVVLASKVVALTISSQSMELDALPVSSSPQKNLLVVRSQPRAWVSASQSTMVTAVAESVREKDEIEAVLETSKLADTEA